MKADTLAHRQAIANLAQADLEKLGYHMPAGYSMVYNDHFAYRDLTTKQLRYTDTRENPGENEVEIYGTTADRPDINVHAIYIFKGATQPHLGPDNSFTTNLVRLDATTYQASMTGTVITLSVDGSINALQDTMMTLAHEEYHAQGHWATTSDNPVDPVEILASTYGLMAERALNKAIIAERN